MRGDRCEGVERFVRLAGFAAERAFCVVAQFGDAGGIATDGDRRERGGRGLAEETAPHLMADLGDPPFPVQADVEDHTVAAQRVVAARRLRRVVELAGAGLRLGERDDALLVELVAHRSVLAACATPASRASMSLLSLYGAIETRVVPSRSNRSISG